MTKPWTWGLGMATFATVGLFTLPALASAATTSSLTVNHNAYLIKQPALHSGRIVLERAGTTLTVEPGGNRYWWHVKDSSGRQGYITTTAYYTHATGTAVSTPGGASGSSSSTAATTPSSASGSPTAAAGTGTSTAAKPGTGVFHLPPGVTLDPSVTPLAGVHATNQQKFNAILQVAKSKIGTPYIWGHNEDRGQYGFDCSNFTEYVYHHALGYKLSTSSKVQYTSVGTTVPKSDMQPGDLLTFLNGAHTGIYVGNGQMIQCGGGLKKVGYLSVAPGSYWGNHISAVKRMY